MKQRLLSIITLFLLIGFSAAFATPEITVGDVSLSVDDAVERSNPFQEGNDDEYDDKDELNFETFSVPITVSNGTVTLTGASFSGLTLDAPLTDENSDVERVTVTVKGKNLATESVSLTNESTTAAVRVLIPGDLDAIDSSFNRVKHTATVSLATSEGSKAATISFYAENLIVLDSLEIQTPDEDIDCDVEEDTSRLDCDDEAEELSPGVDFDVVYDVENKFDSDSDMDLEDVDFSIDSDNNDVEADDDSFEEDIDADETITVTTLFEVDEDAEDGDDARITIEVFVVDENGARHGFEHEFTVEFEVEDYKVDLQEFDVSPTAVCPNEQITISFEIENEGDKEQDNVRVSIENQKLGLSELITGIELDSYDKSDNDFSDSIRFLVPEDTQAGSYAIELQFNYEDRSGSETESTFATLLVRDCGQEDTTTPNDTTGGDIVVTTPPTTVPDTNTPSTSGNQQEVPTQVISQDADNDVLYLVLLILGIVVLLAIIIGLIIYLVR